MERLKGKYLVAIFIGIVLLCVGCSNQVPDQVYETKGLIVPHHLLVEKYLDEIYAQVSSDDVGRIILLSPNHFYLGRSYIQSSEDEELFESFGITLDTEFIADLKHTTLLETSNKNFSKEHGIMNELFYISKYFPKAKLVPIILKGESPQNVLDDLIFRIYENYDEGTLIILSADFSHFFEEKVAKENDYKMIDWISAVIKDREVEDTVVFQKARELALTIKGPMQEKPVGVDSPESVYVFVQLMIKIKAKEFDLVRRTSSAELLGISDPNQNTSHIFAIVE